MLPPVPGEHVDAGMSLVVVQPVQPVVVHETDVSQLVVQLVSVVQCAQLVVVQLFGEQLVCVWQVVAAQPMAWHAAAAHDEAVSTCVSQPPSAMTLADASSETRMTESSFFMEPLRCSEQASHRDVPENAWPR